MRVGHSTMPWVMGAMVWAMAPLCWGVDSFRVATYNLELYTEPNTTSRPAKTEASKAKIRQSIRMLEADVLALQEVGGQETLLELRSSLKKDGIEYPFWEYARGYDTNIAVAVLSRFPVVRRAHHTNEAYLLHGRRWHVTRAFAEVDIQVTPAYKFALITAHLKSRRPIGSADEAELREQEAICLREKIDARLQEDPAVNLVVLGDFNDTVDSRTVRTIVGRGRKALLDTRPAERNGDLEVQKGLGPTPREVTWTHFYARQDSYQRIDYIMLAPGMAREWIPEQTRVLVLPGWGLASDHRPIVAAFAAQDK